MLSLPGEADRQAYLDRLAAAWTEHDPDPRVAAGAAQLREHDDREQFLAALLERRDYRVETDWRPVRVELVRAGGAQVDVHPVVFDTDGRGRQAGFDGTQVG